MKPKQSRTSWGGPKAFSEWAACLAILCAGVAFHSRGINAGLMAVGAVVVISGSVVAPWRIVQRQPGDLPPVMGQAGGLPRGLRRWMLGDSDQSDD